MKIQRLKLLITHLRTFSSFPDYKAMIEAQANRVAYITKPNVKKIGAKTSKNVRLNREVKRYDKCK